MLVLHKGLRAIATCLAVLLLVQACTVYKSANVTLADAAAANTKTKVEYKDGTIVKYLKVGLHENGNYYGMKQEKYKGNKETYKLGIKEMDIAKVQVKNKLASTLNSIGIPVLIIGIAAIVVSKYCCGLPSGNADIPNL